MADVESVAKAGGRSKRVLAEPVERTRPVRKATQKEPEVNNHFITLCMYPLISFRVDTLMHHYVEHYCLLLL